MSMTEAEFLAQYMLPDDERKRLLMGNALLGLGAGLMQSKRGGELTNAGLGLFAGAQQGQNAIFDAQRGQVDKVKLKQMWQEGEAKKAQQTAAADFSRQLSEVDANPQGMKQWEMAMRKAQMAADAGDVKRAEEYRKAAEFYRVKFNPTAQVVMKDGKPTLVQTSEYGDTNELNQYAPQPKFREVNDGKTTRIMNDYQLPETGANIPMQTTPGQDQSAALQRAQMAQSERHWQASQGQGGAAKPQLVNGQWVYAPDAQNPTGRAVTPTGMQAPEKPLTESQAKATAFVHQMQNASQTIEELAKEGFDGKTSVQQAQIVAAGTEGIPLVPGSASLPRFAAGPKAQKFYQAELQWTEGALRFMTGANAPKEEVIRNAATYFPRPGDSDAVIAQKNAARKNMEQSIRLAAGAGAAKVPEKAPSNDYDSLPKGAIYTAPDGTKRRKQ